MDQPMGLISVSCQREEAQRHIATHGTPDLCKQAVQIRGYAMLDCATYGVKLALTLVTLAVRPAALEDLPEV